MSWMPKKSRKITGDRNNRRSRKVGQVIALLLLIVVAASMLSNVARANSNSSSDGTSSWSTGEPDYVLPTDSETITTAASNAAVSGTAASTTDTTGTNQTAATTETKITGTSELSESGKSVSNTYALTVTTGQEAGDEIEYIQINYLDSQNTERTQYILPNGGDYESSCKTAAAAGTIIAKRLTVEKDVFNYSPEDISPSTGKYGTPLSSFSRDTYLFSPNYQISSIKAISFYYAVNSGNTTPGWNCSSMEVYKVSTLYGLEMYGYYSNQIFISFAGQIMAKVNPGSINSTTDLVRRYASSGYTNGELITDFGKQATSYNTTNGSSYYFEIALKDENGAGIESLCNKSMMNKTVIGHKILSQMGICEALVLTVNYKDINGDSRRAVLPFITSVLGWAYEKGVSGSAQLIGIAQQGEKVGFAGYLPDCDEITSYRLDYGYQKTGSGTKTYTINCGVKQSETYGNAYAESLIREDYLSAGGETPDDINIRYVAFYNLSKMKAGAQVDKNTLLEGVDGVPGQIHSSTGEKISLGSSSFHDSLQEGKSSDLNEVAANQYLVSITTDSMALAGSSTSDLAIKLNYVTTAGKSLETGKYNIREQILAYYGYWPTNGGEIAYEKGLEPGGTLEFIVTLRNVDHFTGASISMLSINGKWQMKSIQISSVTSVSRRYLDWTTVKTSSDKSHPAETDRNLYRSVTTGQTMLVSSTPVLLQGKSTQTISVSSGTTTGGTSGTGTTTGGTTTGGTTTGGTTTTGTSDMIDWSQKQFSLSYEETLQDLGFTKSRNDYTVIVDVADDNNSDNQNGNTGSKNLFYFQLVFQDGTSGYVLANQQLSADGFRSGSSESFTISINQDLGDVIGVNIIPDDFTGEDTVFDKLKIDTIRVQQSSSSALSKEWLIDQVGWITIDYKDGGTGSSGSDAGRTESELARSFFVTSSSYVVNLLFSLVTAADQADTAANPQFVGSVRGTLTYIDINGQQKSTTFDVVRAMYEYAGQTIRYSSSGTATGSSAVSDSLYMFRPGKTDRFMVGVSNAKELVSLQLDCTPETTNTVLNIQGLIVQMITSDGVVRLNENNEYERSNTTTPVTQHTSTLTPAYQTIAAVGKWSTINIDFVPDNHIDIDTSDLNGVWSVSVSRVPTTSNDVFNIYAFPSDPNEAADYKLKSQVYYDDTFGASNAAASGFMNRTDDNSMFYALGIDARNIKRNTSDDSAAVSIIKKLTLQAFAGDASGSDDTAYTGMANIAYALVQQVRSGVVVGTYYFNFGGSSSASLVKAEPSAGSLPQEEQVVTFSLGENLGTEQLVKQTYDIAAAISYTLKDDPEGNVYTSPYIFLTDQDYNSISDGNTISLAFHQYYVKDIVGLKLISSSRKLSVPFVKACAASYSNSSHTLCTGWSSFTTAGVITYKGTTFKADDTYVYNADGLEANPVGEIIDNKLVNRYNLMQTPLNLKLTAAAGSLTDYPLKVIVGYLDYNGQSQTAQFDDIRKCLTAAQTAAQTTDETQTAATTSSVTAATLDATVFLQGAKTIRWISIEPVNDSLEGLASINLGTVESTLSSGTNRFSQTSEVNQSAGSGKPVVINCAGIAVGITIKPEGGTAFDEIMNSDAAVMVKSGQAVDIAVNIGQSVTGCTVKTEKITMVGSAEASETVTGLTTETTPVVGEAGTSETIRFKTPENSSGSSIAYRLTISSSEVPSVKCVVNIGISSTAKAEESTDTSGSGTSSSAATTGQNTTTSGGQ